MQFISQNIQKNLYNAGRYNDKDLNRELILDEVAKLIATDTSNVKKAIVDADIPVGSLASKKEMGTIISTNINNNSKLRRNLSVLIKNHNRMSGSMNFDGVDSSNNGKNKKDIKTEDFIYNSMYFAFSGDGDASADQVNKTLLEKIKAHLSNVDMLTGKDKVKVRKTIIYTSLISVAVVVGGYFLVRYIIKKRREKYESGGALGQENEQMATGGDPMQQNMQGNMNAPMQAPMSTDQILATQAGTYDMSYMNNNTRFQ